MKVTTKLTQAEYTRFLFFMYYRKPYTIFTNVLGILLIVAVVIYFKGQSILNEKPLLQIALGVFLITSSPFKIYKASEKFFETNSRIKEAILYDFTGNKLLVTGESFSGEKDMGKVYKILELKDWFLIYENNTTFNLISKKDMTRDEQLELRAVLSNVKIAGEKKLRAD